jgi:hypothetical protein
MTGLSKKFKNEFGEDNLVEESLIIPARDPKQCVVRILRERLKGPKSISGSKLEGSGQERP